MTGDLDGWLLQLTRVGAVASGVIGGVYAAFSLSVMPALRRLPQADGMRTMQVVNDRIQNPLFLTLFLGSGLVGVGLAASAAFTWDQPGAGWRLAGGLLVAVGSLGLTIAYNVPRNDALAALDPGSAAGAAEWARYLTEWVRANHLRGVASIASAGALVMALRA